MFRNSTFIVALTLIGSPAVAGPVIVTGDPAPSATVSIADLQLGSPAGHAKAVSRLRGAASDLCLTTAVESVDARIARGRCYRTALSSGMLQLERIVASARTSASLPAAVTLTAR